MYGLSLDLVRKLSTKLPIWGEILPESGVLLREFIRQSLYNPSAGYFTNSPQVVGQLPSPLPYKSFYTKGQYDRHIRKIYDSLQIAWLTPSELFYPFYGHSIARFLLARHLPKLRPSDPLQIFEIGAGGGAVARSVLDYLLLANPDVHARTLYRTVEVSPGLAERQRQRVLSERAHEDHFAVEVRDASDPQGWRQGEGGVQSTCCAILGFEVLDNMPHDRVLRSQSNQWFETHIVPSATPSGLKEVTKPLADPLLIEACSALGILDRPPSTSSDPSPIFVPTTAFSFLKAISAARPNHTLLLGDFDALPGVKIEGEGAPLVSATINGYARDYHSYLLPPGSADIFFPTDFQALSTLYQQSAANSSNRPTAETLKNVEFQRRFAGSKGETRTPLGFFDPLRDDFVNTAFLIGESGQRH